ncbi:HlyD family efflux transporter periplasmic adaptor subunit [Psychrobacter sp. Ps6]|uniref:HlyD family efflux transporter periplasmic adaptor subunit n=1 Tax=Psychrobacter sp. Ps6 TaxID=2790960 RepID=UPI001EDE1710|nr:HlyD family efflux transporter periplasmic adaptor subunit [Psychrobacter sp. Ps6]MCG3880036.1 HlyD family efflux transporter periplasmic adaptor subunit [Psychrobacter sp. Ps6]
MTAFKHSKKSLYLLSVLLLAACQPSPSENESVAPENTATADSPVVITNDSVTMTPEHILSIKSSRYQPSLGLQGSIEPIKQTKFIAVHPVNIEKTFVSEGQWVEKGTPLLVIRRLAAMSDPTVKSDTSAEGNSSKEKIVTSTTNNKKPENTPSIDDNSDSSSTKALSVNNDANVNNTSNDKEASSAANLVTDNNNAVSNGVNVDGKKLNPRYNLVTITASFSGRVENLYVTTGEKTAARTSLLELSDETKLHFAATLPIQAEPQLSVGQTVNFTIEGNTDKFTGQVSKLVPTSQPKRLLVYVNVIDNEVSRNKLQPEMKVTGRVNYGQIDVGTIVPKRALHDVDLTELQKPPYMPLKPLTANVWIIGQDQRLTRQPIEVVEYDPTTQQYLIAGVSNDSLICLADLPIDSEGKKVIVS